MNAETQKWFDALNAITPGIVTEAKYGSRLVVTGTGCIVDVWYENYIGVRSEHRASYREHVTEYRLKNGETFLSLVGRVHASLVRRQKQSAKEQAARNAVNAVKRASRAKLADVLAAEYPDTARNVRTQSYPEVTFENGVEVHFYFHDDGTKYASIRLPKLVNAQSDEAILALVRSAQAVNLAGLVQPPQVEEIEEAESTEE